MATSPSPASFTNSSAPRSLDAAKKRPPGSSPGGLSLSQLVLCPFYFGDPSAADCVTSNIFVPPSSRTFVPAEVITDPCVPFAVALLRFNSFSPNTPRLFDVNCPAAFNPPTAPLLQPRSLSFALGC